MLVGVAKGRALPAAKAVIGNRYRNWHVDADHADIDTRGELTRCVTIAGEYGNAIAILMVAGKRQCFFEVCSADHLQHGAKNLFLVAFHVGRDMVEQSWANEVTFFMSLQLEPASVDNQLAAFVNAGLDPAFNLCFMLRGNHGAIMRFGIG